MKYQIVLQGTNNGLFLFVIKFEFCNLKTEGFEATHSPVIDY